ncbi:S8 family serine peptidase [Fictibacillus barbaricus]|uniref:S8 family serine peptidase n=2 Tax=Fictibacillus barbaricus TaxID=182136 RepID=A0ABS2Z7T6_9BACL|nr:S8 family serine peptidase [Fictibacillus barbaricus]
MITLKNQDTSKISPKLLSQFKDDKHVTFLVKLKQQVNTPQVASIATQQTKDQKKSPFQTEIIKRSTIVSTLRLTAEETQFPLKQLLTLEKKEGRVKSFQSFYIVNAIAVTGTKEVMNKLANYPEVDKILPNETRQLVDNHKFKEINTSLLNKYQIQGRQFKSNEMYNKVKTTNTPEWNIERIGAPRVWEQGIDGTGVVVANIDTGVQWDHPSLKEKYRGYKSDDPDHPDHTYNWFDAVDDSKVPFDNLFHGTHTMGTIVGSERDGKNQIGVAPGATWIAVKAFSAKGGTDVDLLEAGEWIIAPKDKDGNPHPEKAPDVVNNSWGGGPGLDEWYRPMIEAWRAADIFPEFSAGNDGSAEGTIAHPANYPESFATGATDDQNKLADFSSRGPSLYGKEIKPDISAPGVNIRSAFVGGGYIAFDGTSMAGPHVSGAVALLKQVNASLSIDEIEEILLSSSTPLKDSRYPTSPNMGYGYGLLNVHRAVEILNNEGLGKINGTVSTTLNGKQTGIDAQVTVLETGRSTMTNATDGSYTLTQPSGEYTLQAEAYGFKPAKQRVTVTKHKTTIASFDMQPIPKGKVKGHVTNEKTGRPVANATVSLVEDAAIKPVKTDNNGYFLLSAYEGNYTLQITAPYSFKTTAKINVTGNKETEKNVRLKFFTGTPEEIGYDDGTGELALARNYGDGFAVKISLKEGQNKALLTGGLFMLDTIHGSSQHNQFQVAVFDANGKNRGPGRKIAGPIDATAKWSAGWTYVDLLDESIIVDKEFYLVYIQKGNRETSPRLVVDENGKLDYMWGYVNGSWEQGLQYWKYMIRATVSYEVKAPVITSPTNSSLFTNKKTITLKGMGSPKTKVRIDNKGKEKAIAPTKTDGSFTIPVTLDQNENTLTATTITEGGPTKPSSPLKVILDQTKPTLTITSHKNGYQTNEEAVTIKGKVSDKHLNKVSINGRTAFVSKDGMYSARVLLHEGANNIKVTAIDKAGNQQTKQITLFAKFSPPTMKNIKPAKDIFAKSGQKIKIELDSQRGLKGTYILRMPLTGLSTMSTALNEVELPLRETSSGHYVGYWTTPHKTIPGAVIEIKLTDEYGNEVRKRAVGKLYINTKK